MLRKSLLLITLSFILSTDLISTALVANASQKTVVSTEKSALKTPGKKPKNRKRGLKIIVSGVRTSRNLEAGAARGVCSPNAISAILSPKSKSQKPGTIPIEKTLSDHPTFFVHIPETSAKQASFLLTDEKGTVVLEKTLDMTTKSGIVAYTLPTEFQGLETSKNYRWRLSLLCDADDRSGDANAGGWIAQEKPTQEISKALQLAKEDLDRIDIYTQNGYWQDSLKGLIDLRAANPADQDLASDWSSLLKSAGLESLAQQPVIQLRPSESTN